jgi:nucleotide-binding universal stress UspA family protein
MLKQVLVPLDGSRLAEAALSPAAYLAQKLGAEDYLSRHTSQLEAQGVSAKAEIGRGEAVANIIDETRKTGADLIVMGTHGKAGIDAFWSGSIAPKVSSRSRLPLLPVPITKTELNQEISNE